MIGQQTDQSWLHTWWDGQPLHTTDSYCAQTTPCQPDSTFMAPWSHQTCLACWLLVRLANIQKKQQLREQVWNIVAIKGSVSTWSIPHRLEPSHQVCRQPWRLQAVTRVTDRLMSCHSDGQGWGDTLVTLGWWIGHPGVQGLDTRVTWGWWTPGWYGVGLVQI